jgi:glycosyltransferase involved in cell wall biosynthesis
VGAGPDRQRLERLARGLGIAEHVIFTGFVSNPFALMRRADVFVSASHAESFGNVIVEAMAAGVPVISTRVPSGPETIISDSETGIFANARDPTDLAAKIASVLSDRRAAQAMAARARAAVARYDVRVVVEQYEDLLERVAAGAAGAAHNRTYTSHRAHRG